ncbi:DUF2599 domain-containing protein, partial [Rhodococcus sp. IEGM 1408]|uniref:DUF2599 domain-containing protein n=1 Tax=Rhodococcus sp. IEGM 1408 TaxID=3082220 RepID=UPI00295433F1
APAAAAPAAAAPAAAAPAAGSATGSLGFLAVTTGSASSDSHKPSPYIADVQWVNGLTDRALRVTPTEAGRTSWGPRDEADAWAELVALEPGVDTPGMHQQFSCHWVFARVVDPTRRAWQFEPWRPVVPDAMMIATGCNPGSGSSSGS